MLDTENKRRSAVNQRMFSVVLPRPDGTLDVGDRANRCWVYAGLSYTPPTPSTGGGGWIAAIIRRRRR